MFEVRRADVVVHVIIGLTAIGAAYAAVDAALYANATIAGAIAYISWFGRRGSGLAIACGVGLVEIVSRLQPPTPSALGVAWAIAYLLLAWIVSSIEEATRPEP